MKPAIKIDPVTSDVMDGLRGASALVVACVHGFQVFLIPYFGLGTPSHILTSFAATHAVTIFFVVSGFMICVSVFRHRNANSSFRTGEFAEARILRIYPPLIAALLITVTVYLLISGLCLHGSESYRLGGEVDVVRERATLEWSALPSTFFLLYGAVPHAPPPINMDGSLWTLAYEWWFYILAFLCARLWNGLRIATITPLAAVLIMLLYGRNTLFLWFLLIWLGGFALGFAYLTGALFTVRSRWLAVLVAVVILAMCVLGQGDLSGRLLRPFDGQSAQRMMVCVGWLITLAIAGLMRSRARWSFLHAAAGLAGFSYTLYVIHFPLLLLAYSLLHPITHDHSWMIAAISAAIAIAVIVYVSSSLSLIVENRVIISKWKDAFRRNLRFKRQSIE
jgi:peptidoglycan/LPS O-acetylase OafA/YrhL